MSASNAAPVAGAAHLPPVVDEAELGPGVFSYWAKRWSKGRLTAGWFMIAVSLATVIMSPLAIWFGWLVLRSPNFSAKSRAKRVDLHQRGLVLHDGQGPVAVHRFESMSVTQKIVTNYYNGVKTGTNYLFTITGPDGRTDRLTQFYDNIEHLIQSVQQGVVEAQLPHAVAALEAGYPVAFGAFTVTAQGLVCGTKSTVTWPLLHRVTVSQGTVRIMVHGRRTALFSRPVHAIPNFQLFLSLVSHARATAAEAQPAQPA